MPATAGQRKGIQPVVELKANGGERAEVAVGEPVTFTATIETPPKGGKVVAADGTSRASATIPSPSSSAVARPR